MSVPLSSQSASTWLKKMLGVFLFKFVDILGVYNFTYVVIVIFTFKLLYKMIIKNCHRVGQMALWSFKWTQIF